MAAVEGASADMCDPRLQRGAIVSRLADLGRQAAFEATSFLMDYLKSRAPFWKKEHRADGSEGDWVEAKEADDRAAAQWKSV